MEAPMAASELCKGKGSATKDACLKSLQSEHESDNYSILRDEDNRFHPAPTSKVWQAVRTSITTQSPLQADSPGLIDEYCGTYGTSNICLDIDAACSLTRDELVCFSTQLSERLVRVEARLAATEQGLASARNSINSGLGPLVYCIEGDQTDVYIAPVSGAKATASIFASPLERRDKVSIHVVIKPTRPVASNQCAKLLVLVGLAKLLTEQPCCLHEIAQRECMKALLFATTVDLGVYSAADAHLRLPMTMKRGKPATLLEPVALVREGCDLPSLKTTLSDAQLQPWLELVATACTLNYVPTEATDTQFCAIGDPSSLPVVFLAECKSTLMKVLKVHHKGGWAVPCKSLSDHDRAALGRLIDTFEYTGKQLDQILEARREGDIFNKLRLYPKWKPPASWVPVLSGLLKVNQIGQSVVAGAIVALGKTFRKDPSTPIASACCVSLKLHKSQFFSEQTRLDEHTHNKVALSLSRWFNRGDMALPFLQWHSTRSILPVYTESVLEHTCLVDTEQECVWRSHKTADLKLKLRLKLDQNGRPEIVVQFNCWKDGCSKNIHATLDAAAYPVFERHVINTHTVLGTQHGLPWLQKAPKAFSQLDLQSDLVRNGRPNGHFDTERLVEELGELSVYLERMRPWMKKITRCYVITEITQTTQSAHEWTVCNDLVSPAHQFTVTLPLAWNNPQRALFKRWTQADPHFCSEGTSDTKDTTRLSRSNPGIIYVTWCNEIVGYTYILHPESLRTVAAGVDGTASNATQFTQFTQLDLVKLNPLLIVENTSQLLRFQMALHVNRPYSLGTFKVFFDHTEMYSAVNPIYGGRVNSPGAIDTLVWRQIFKPIYVQLFTEGGSNGSNGSTNPVEVAMILAPLLPAEKMEGGRASRVTQSGLLQGATQGSSTACPTKNEVGANSNRFWNPFGFRCVVCGMNRFRELMQQLFFTPANESNALADIRFVIDSPFAVTNSCAAHHQRDGEPVSILFSPRDELAKLDPLRGTAANQVVLPAAHLVDLGDGIRFLERLSGLLANREAGAASLQVVVLLTAHCYPSTCQLGSPWIAAAHEMAIRERVVYTSAKGGVSFGYPLCYDSDLMAFVKLIAFPGTEGRLPGADCASPNSLKVHVTYNQATALPKELVAQALELKRLQREPAATKKKEKKRAAAAKALDEQVRVYSVAELDLERNSSQVKQMLDQFASTRPLDDCNWCPDHRWPEHVVLLTNNKIVPHHAVRLLAAFQQGEGYPCELHIVAPAYANNKRKRDGNTTATTPSSIHKPSHSVLQPYQVVNMRGLAQPTTIGFHKQYFPL